jgi:hypothetical protein
MVSFTFSHWKHSFQLTLTGNVITLGKDSPESEISSAPNERPMVSDFVETLPLHSTQS